MTYQPLARKYRPTTFADLIGQREVSQALSNAVTLGREPSALIFTGTRGVGKTTSARLFAKALNCDAGPTPEPCGTCYSCKAIAGGFHEDVLEIDGASHNGVAEVRALQETVTYTTQRSRFKVFIVDEVHMLSASAFNALLKTLEEPPARVIFIFATTEIHKVPKTVTSRCQVFYLHDLGVKDIAARVRYVLTAEQIAFDESVITLVAREAMGSVRDALSFLDQVIAMSGGKRISHELVAGMVTRQSASAYGEMVAALNVRDRSQVLALIAAVARLGVGFDVYSAEVATSIRHILVMKHVLDPCGTAIALTEDESSFLRKLGESVSDADLHGLFRLFVSIHSDMNGSELDRFVLENYCLEWCLGASSVAEVPKPLAEEVQAASDLSSTPGQTRELAKDPRIPPDAPTMAMVPPEDPTNFPASWEELVAKVKRLRPIQGRKLEECYLLEYSQDAISVAVKAESLAAYDLLREEVQRRWTKEFKEQFGFKGDFRVKKKQQPDQSAASNSSLGSESLSDKKAKERDAEKARIFAEAIDHPVTQGFINKFSAKIETIDLSR